MPASPLILLLVVGVLAGCGSEASAPAPPTAPLPAGARPIGPGPRFHPALREGTPIADCRRGGLGARDGVHLELFGDDLVVLFPAGLGTRPPRTMFAGRIERARCYGPVVTIDPTGLVLLRPGTRATVGDVFSLWGQRLSAGRAASFRGAVRVYVNGRRVAGEPGAVPLRRHDNIVLQVGPFVPPHARYTFPAGY